MSNFTVTLELDELSARVVREALFAKANADLNRWQQLKDTPDCAGIAERHLEASDLLDLVRWAIEQQQRDAGMLNWVTRAPVQSTRIEKIPQRRP